MRASQMCWWRLFAMIWGHQRWGRANPSGHYLAKLAHESLLDTLRHKNALYQRGKPICNCNSAFCVRHPEFLLISTEPELICVWKMLLDLKFSCRLPSLFSVPDCVFSSLTWRKPQCFHAISASHRGEIFLKYVQACDHWELYLKGTVTVWRRCLSRRLWPSFVRFEKTTFHWERRWCHGGYLSLS